MNSKEIAVIPANAELIEEYDEPLDAKIRNTALFLLASVPGTGFYGIGFDGSFGNLVFPVAMGWMVMAMTYAFSPFEIEEIHSAEKKDIKQYMKLMLVKFPVVSRFVNEEAEWTETDPLGIEKDQKHLVVIRKGKMSVYNLPAVDPKAIWDRMYQEETGEAIEHTIAYRKTIKKFTPVIDTMKSPNPENGNQRSFLRRLLG